MAEVRTLESMRPPVLELAHSFIVKSGHSDAKGQRVNALADRSELQFTGHRPAKLVTASSSAAGKLLIIVWSGARNLAQIGSD